MIPPRAWVLAARPVTLWAAVVPVLVGGGLAWGEGRGATSPAATLVQVGPADRIFRWDAFGVTLIAALAIQVAANFANDASDAARGVDDEHRIGPMRAVASGLIPAPRMWAGVWTMFAIAAACGIYLAVIAGPVIIAIGVVSVIATLTYVGGPRPYGYMGLGELFVFVFFGVVATVGSRFVHDSTAPAAAWLLSLPVGCLVTAILVANNIRDIDGDAAAGKRTLAVIVGRTATARLFGGLIYGAFGLIIVLAAAGRTPPWTLLAVAAMPLALPVTRTVATNVAGPPLIRALKGTARLHLIVGALLALGAAIG